MTTLPWIKKTHQSQEYFHCLASVLPLKHYRDIPRFLFWTIRIFWQLKTAKGLVGFSLKAELTKKRFWTLSAWESQEDMMNFVRNGFHGAMLPDMRGRLGQSKFQEWEAKTEDLPLTWKLARQRLDVK